MRAKQTVLAAVAMIITVGLVVGFVTGAFTSLARTGLYATGLWSTNGPSVLPSTTSDVPTPSATPSRPPATPELDGVHRTAGRPAGAGPGRRRHPAYARIRSR